MLTIPGKIPYVKRASLKLAISAGIMIDQQDWVPITEHHNKFGNKYAEPYESIVVTVTLDDCVLAQQNMQQPLNLECEFLDTSDYTEHCLTITVEGFDLKFYDHVQGIGSPYPMIRIDTLSIEDLSMLQLIQDLDTRVSYQDSNTVETSVMPLYMGSRSYQTLKFSTPIYVWLLDNDMRFGYYRFSQ